VSDLKAVLFDLGDTLWHFPQMPPHKVIRAETVSRIRSLIQSWDYEFTEGRYMLGRDIRFAIEDATHEAFHGDNIDPGYPELCRKIAAKHDMELTTAQSEELWDTWNLGGAFLGRKLFPDALETLHWLRDSGYRIGCVTNRGHSGPSFHQELADLGLTDLFETTVISYHLGYMKPHPKIYEEALTALSLEPHQAAMVGDSLHADVGGSKALGIVAIWRKPPKDEPVDETEDEPAEDEPGPAPDYTITTLAQIKDIPLFADGRADG
jgi:HAD superfamily hydrolase (TIGR01549 family)